MKKVLILMAFLSFLSAQAIYNPKVIYPFITGNDTILSAANINSGDCNISGWRGACLLGIQADTMTAGGTVAKAIDVYAKIKIDGLNYGVPFDSLAADSVFIGQLDSANVNDEVPFYFDLSNESWWGWVDRLQIILDPATGADSIRILSRLKGQ